MTISSASVGDPIPASVLNQVYAHVNNGHGRAVFTANGSWAVPVGVHQFRVYLCGGGANGSGATMISPSVFAAGLAGGLSPLASAVISGQAIGASFAVTVGAAAVGTGAGGTTSFGSLMQVTGGQYTAGLADGATGVATFPPGAPEVYHSNGSYGKYVADGTGVRRFTPYGSGGSGGTEFVGAGAGVSGVCVVEW